MAWNTLRDDRFYGSMGGMGTIYYTAIRTYAEDHNIPMYPFLTFIRAMDETFMAVCAEKQKEADAAAATDKETI